MRTLLSIVAFAVVAMLPGEAQTIGPGVTQVLRRFSFGADPSEAARVYRLGVSAWLDEQLDPRASDPALASKLEARPNRYNAKNELADPSVYDRRLLERELFTKLQLREKVTLFWLEHFSVGGEKVDDRPMMGRYEEALRANALGNFRRLLSVVSVHPAMLRWLDNDGNDGSSPRKMPPNENFARELLQLYAIGAQDETGAENYRQADVREVALALTGYYVDCAEPSPKISPNARCSTKFNVDAHAAGRRTLFGKPLAVPANAHAIDAVIDAIVRHPATATFMARQILHRMVTDHPSPRFVSDIARVWQINTDAPDQIAQVVRAIVSHAEFGAVADGTPKTPPELIIGALRALPGVIKSAVDEKKEPIPPGNDVVEDYLPSMGERPFEPPSVFSFYRPGERRSLVNDAHLAVWMRCVGALSESHADDAQTNTAIDFDVLRERIGSANAAGAADYLVNALVGGGSPSLRKAIRDEYKDPGDDEQLRRAVWLVLSSPEYQML